MTEDEGSDGAGTPSRPLRLDEDVDGGGLTTGDSPGAVRGDPSASPRKAPPLEDWPAWMLGAAGVLVCLVLYMPTATWDFNQVTDPRATAIAGWSLAEHGSIQVDTTWPDVPWAQEGPDGNHYIWRHPGGIVWAALFYLPGSTGADPTSALDVPYGPATVSVVLATALGVGAMIMVFRRLVTAPVALVAGLVLGLGTSNWSISADGPWNHGLTLLFLALGLLASSEERHTWAGVSFAAAITARPHVAVAPLAVGLAAGWRQRRFGPVFAVGIPSVIGLLAVVWFYDHFFGTPTLRPEQTAAFVTGDVNLTDHGWGMNAFLSLVHPDRGLFLFSPFLLFLLPGVRTAWRSAPSWVRASAISSILYLAIQTRADVWHAGAGFFGYRGPLETVTLAAPLLLLVYAHYAEHRPSLRRLTELTAMASVIVFAFGSTMYAPLKLGDTHCFINNYVAYYRPVEEQVQGIVRDLVDCQGFTPEDARAHAEEWRSSLQ